MLASPSRLLSFDQFTLDTVRCVLLRGELELHLRPQSFEVLRYLAEHAGKVVSSDELIAALWSSRPADNNSVVQCIKEIRRAIGDDGRWIIKTLSGHGYEFMAEVMPVAPVRSDIGPPTPMSLGVVAGKPVATTTAVAAGEGEPLTRRASERPSWRLDRLLALPVALVIAVWMLWPWLNSPPSNGVFTMMAAPSIAVLPFRSVGQELDQNDISAALTED